MRVFVRKPPTPEWRKAAVRRRAGARTWGRVLVGLGGACLFLCVWRLAVDLEVLTEFPFEGAAARWQTWLAAAAVCGATAWAVLGGADPAPQRRAGARVREDG